VAGGLKLGNIRFTERLAHTLCSFMFVITGGVLILPAAFDRALPDTNKNVAGVVAFSRFTAVVLLLMYLQFMFFQMKSHSHLFNRHTLGRVNTGDRKQDSLHGLAIVITIIPVTIAVATCSDFLVNSINDVVVAFGVTKTFVGLIIVPLIGNAGTPL
jgi:Ca2+:H+ antiporter